MKTHTNYFKNGIKEFGKEIDSKITYTIDNEEIELGSEDLNSVSPHYESAILKSTMRQLDIDSNVEIPLETVINYQFGLKVGNEYEYLNFGNYVVYNVEKQEDTNSYKITCYDKMLYSMIPYEVLPITYPITIRNYIIAICTKLGLTFKNASDTFANYDKIIENELYVNIDGKDIGYTFRDVFDELAEVTGSTICINEDTDELEIRYVNNTGTQTTVEGTSISIENSDDEKIDLQLQGNTTQETTPTPDSPVPINVVSGSQNITVCGKNLYNKDVFVQGTWQSSSPTNRIVGFFIPTKAGQKYRVSLRNNELDFAIGNTTKNVQSGNTQVQSDSGWQTTDYTYTITGDGYLFLQVKKRYGGNLTPSDLSATDFQVELGETGTTFEEYKGNNYEINLGKNLWNEDYANISTGIKYKPIYVGEGTFTMSSNIPQSSSGNSIFFLTGNVSSGASSSTNGVDKTISRTITSTNGYITIGYRGGGNFLDPTDYETQLEKGSQASPYSAYKTPIELCKIGDYQDFIKKGTGKNLLPYPYTQSTITNNGVTFTVNEDGTILVNGTASGGNASIKLLGNYQVDNQVVITGKYLYGGTSTIRLRAMHNENGTYTTLANDTGTGAEIDLSTYKTGYIELIVYNGTTVNKQTIKPMVLNSLEDTTYEPYGMYNKWYIEKNIGKVVLDGTQTLSRTNTGTTGYYRFNVGIGENIFTTDSTSVVAPIYCNRLKGVTRGNTFSRIEGVAPTTNNYNYRSFNLYIEALSQMTVEQANTWLSNNPTIVYYQYKTPTYTEITDSDLIEQLNAPRLFEGLNNVSVSSGDLGSPIKITYTSELDTIDEEYLKDINVNFGEKFGKVNSIVLSRSAESDNIYLRDEESVLENGLCEIKIKDNQIMNGNNRSDFLPELLETLDGLEYYINDYSSPGIVYYNVCDMYNVSIGENTYNCLMLNDEVNVTQGLEENIFTNMPEESETDYTKADKTDIRMNQTTLIVDKHEQEIQALASKIVDISNIVEGTGEIDLDNAFEGELYSLEIRGNISLVFPNDSTKYGEAVIISDNLIVNDNQYISSGIPYANKDTLYPSNLLYPKDTYLQVDDTLYKLDFDYLNYISETTYDKYILRDGEQWIERNVGIDENGNLYALENTIIEKKQDLIINVKSNSHIKLLSFANAILKSEYLLNNKYTDTFATQAYVKSEIKVATDEINAEVSAKVDEDEIVAKLNLGIRDGQGVVELKGNTVLIESDNFQLDETGKINATAGNIAGFGMNGEQGFVKEVYTEYDYTNDDYTRLVNILAGTITPTQEDYDKYDFDENGQLNSADLLLLRFILSNGISTTNPITFIIDAPETIKQLNKLKIGYIDPNGNYINGFGVYGASFSSVYLHDNRTPNATTSMSNSSINLQYLGGNTITMANETGNITCVSLTQTSLKENKKNFEKYEDSAIDEVKKIDIYKYNLKNEKDDDKKHIGFVIGDNYNYSQEITSKENNGVDNYAFTSLLCKAIQEQQEQIEELKKEIKLLKEEQ